VPIDALIALWIPIFLGLALSFVLEQAHLPRPQLPWKRSSADLLLHSGCWLLLYLLEFIQFGRPWLALCLTSTIFYVLLLINHAKYDALREPFIYQDFEYFVDALKHPRLYLPFFGFFKIVGCLVVVGLALWLGISLETALSQSVPLEQVRVAGLLVLVFALVLLYAGHRREAKLSFHPTSDFTQRGLIALCWHYARAERRALAVADLVKQSTLGSVSLAGGGQQLDGAGGVQHKKPNDTAVIPSEKLCNTQIVQSKKLYDTVVVQSESFFDPRRAFGMIKPSVLSEFDQACRTATLFGTLTVPAWGANTVRTEFSFLTGINPTMLGVDQFNPYRRLVSPSLPSLAREFKQRGYRTVCIHPYPASFYQRDKIFNVLGFDEFIDLKSFAQTGQTTHQQDQGPYVSDQALTDKILETLAQPHEQPIFIFAITMENHGPLHLEQITDSEQRQWVSEPLPQNCQELAIYLRHLANADQMILRLLKRLSAPDAVRHALGQGSVKESTEASAQGSVEAPNQQLTASHNQRPAQLLWYGDHVPVLTKVYEQFGYPDGHTDYFLWRSDETSPERARAGVGSEAQQQLSPQPLHVYQLAAELL
jgi:phosphoglycerol transferase MdoB-like AlkP superfamily enzyme